MTARDRAGYEDVLDGIGVCVATRIPFLLWGEPGAGKTAVVESAEHSGFHVETLICSHYEPSDFAGLPVVNRDGTVTLAPPGWAVRTAEEPRPSIVFFDEWTTAAPAVQAAALRPLTHGQVGELQLPTDVSFGAAANPADVAASGWELAAPTANRFVHIDWTLPLDVFTESIVMGQWPRMTVPAIPASYDAQLASTRGLVAGFLRARGGQLSSIPSDAASRGRAFPTPRTWDYTARLVALAQAVGLSLDVSRLLVHGAIGAATGHEFLTWMSSLDLPDPEWLLASGGATAFVGLRADRVHVTLQSVLAAVSTNRTPERWTAAMAVCVAAATEAGVDPAVPVVRSLLRGDGRPRCRPPRRDGCLRGTAGPRRTAPPMTSESDRPPGTLSDGLSRDVSDRLAAAKLWLVSTTSPTTCGDLPYLATALYALIPVPTTRVRDMTVDRHWRVYVNPGWILATDVPVVAARIAHMVWHLLAEHSARSDDLDVHKSTARHWQAAADATVAELLTRLDTGLATPDALGFPTGRSAEEYYARISGLPAARAADPDRRGDKGEEEEPGSDPQDQSCGSGCDGQLRDYDLPIGHSAGGLGDADADEIRRRVAIEFRDHLTRIGSQPGEWSRWVAAILEPVVPWTQVLAAAVRRGVGWAHGHTDYTYTRISRRQSAAGRVILPATRRPIPEVAIVVDTSGSIDDGLLSQALGEVDGVLTGLGVSGRSVTVLATDAAVHAVTRVHSARDTRIHGGGGTDLRVGIREALDLKPRPTLIVVLTDGYTPWPQVPTPIPIIAVIIGRHRFELPATPGWMQRVECVPT